MSIEKLKILHVHDVASVGSTLVSGLNEIGLEADFYEFQNLNDPHFPKVLKLFLTLFLRVFEIFRFGHYLQKSRPDIIHIHYGSFAYLPLLNKVPYFLHIHGTDLRKYIHWPLLGKIIRQGIKKAKAVLYTTPDLKTLIEPMRPDAIFFPNPIDIEVFKPRKEPSTATSIQVFNINKIDRLKGIFQVLKAIELLWEEKPDTNILMFNFGNSKEEASDFWNRHKTDPRLAIAGRVSHDQMVSLINNSTLILGQMKTGALGCSELEAMACGKPVVCKFSHHSMYTSPTPPLLCRNSGRSRRCDDSSSKQLCVR